MVEVQFDPELEERVRKAAEEQQVSESFLVGEVVRRWLQDREDYVAGMRALSQMKYTISQEEMERRSDVAG
jgi:predicted DNA-binding protein